jgi:iron(III) transport system permease protein
MLAVLVFFIVLPLLSVFSKALATPKASLEVLLQKENVRMILSSLLLGVLVVIVSTLFAYPLAFLFSSTKFSRMMAFDIIFMIPFMTPPTSRDGWISCQSAGTCRDASVHQRFGELFLPAGLVLVMSLHVFRF